MAFEWSCTSCTYKHKAPGKRCVMCGNLRNASTQEMRAFIEGKTINLKPASSECDSLQQKPQSPREGGDRGEPINPYTSSVRNPYAAASTDIATIATGVTTIIATDRRKSPLLTDENRPPQQPDVGPSDRSGTATTSECEDRHRVRTPLLCMRTSSGYSASRSTNAIVDPNSSLKQGVDPFVLAAHRPQIYQPGPVALDIETSKEWIYPVHPEYPVRDYQLEITQTAIQYNTLVSLPTGLGKTLIAAVVLYNFYRWFPHGGKVLFLAPTLPLVDQQVKACYQIMGIPASDTAVLNGKVPAPTRESLWRQRRVFFCTPQTVEKDIDAGRCPASQVVCLVLDEAHKAMGNFAYTKVVELCEAAGAHFRILGLSATPGAKVQQVQKVIDALRITRLEARSEDEVKQYIHERHNEIVVVKKRTICHDIEQKFHALIEPVMLKLRSTTNIGRKIGSSDHTLTSFCIHRARQYHHETTSDHRLDGYFFAAQKLIDARSNLFSHGIGSVRTKLLELRNTPQRGVLATIVKSPEFAAVVDAVISASSGKQSQETAEDKKGNNPKLEKLDEILREHFLRADASGYTTRAIVFSQWRDSVSEIVDVLSLSEPLIRPRHFVGQSSGSGNKLGSMKGMPQKVQQQVISDFQQGAYNVLVCTCIGEEGLDIGEVDLIVNYDTLRSPIRMIQRVGRTGRKRDGRVVCLVSEGQEEKDMIRSKSNEKSLQRALRRSDNFKLRPNRIMFPEDPKLIKKTMVVTEKLRLSEVGGHAEPLRNKKESSGGVLENWKLSGQVESIRFHTFGPIEGVSPSTTSFPVCLKRKLLRARTKSHGCTTGSVRKPRLGTTTLLLLSIETRLNARDQSSTTRKLRVIERDYVRLFPFEDAECLDANAVVKYGWDERIPLPTVAHINVATAFPATTSENDEVTAPVSERSLKDEKRLLSSNHVEGNHQRILHFKPGAHKKNAATDDSDPIYNSPEYQKRRGMEAFSSQAHKFELPTPPGSSSESDVEIEPDEMETLSRGYVSHAMEIILPTPNSSSDSDNENTDNEEDEGPAPKEELRGTHEIVSLESNQLVGGCNKSSCGGPLGITNQSSPLAQTLLLPTQDSSSDGSECADDKSFGPETSTTELEYIPSEEAQPLVNNLSVDCELAGGGKGSWKNFPNRMDTYRTSSRSLILSRENFVDPDLIYTPNSSSMKEREVELYESVMSRQTPIESEFELHEASPELVVCRSRSSGINVIMTQRCEFTYEAQPASDAIDQGFQKLKTPNNKASDCLVDTPLEKTWRQETHDQDATDIICSVCHCADSNKSDPIVLCDGIEGIECDIAVHVSCYSLDKSILSRVDEWRCDPCEQRGAVNDMALNPRCSVCKKSGGILKRSSRTRSAAWTHPFCMSWGYEHVSVSCDLCSFSGASTCAFASCSRAAHPHCVRDIAAENCWMTIIDTFEECRTMFCFEHRHEKHSLYRFCPVEEEQRLPKCLILPTCRVQYLNVFNTNKSELSKRDPDKPKNTFLSKKIPNEGKSKNAIRQLGKSPYKNERRKRVERNLMLRQQRMLGSVFIHSEADIDTDEDAEGDDEEASQIRQIDEEEELAALDFINDTSQLGTYTQDALDRVDGEVEEGESIYLHRRLDIENERKRQFSTPILNRRMIRKRTNSFGSEGWDESQNSSASRSSLRGLGNCHFIRSVIEHAKRGGTAEDIEAVYTEVEQMVALEEEEAHADGRTVLPVGRPLIVDYVPSDEDDDEFPPSASVTLALTEEQKAIIEKNRLEALARRTR